MVRKPMKIGTTPVRNHIRASRIREITGTDLMVTSMGVIKVLNPGLIPARIPIHIPSNPDKINPVNPLTTVLPATIRKPGSANNFTTARNVASGCGMVSGESNTTANTFHKTSIRIMERTVRVFFLVIKCFIGHLSSYNFRV